MADIGQKSRLGEIGAFGPVLGVAQFGLGFLPLGDIDAKDDGAAIGQTPIHNLIPAAIGMDQFVGLAGRAMPAHAVFNVIQSFAVTGIGKDIGDFLE